MNGIQEAPMSGVAPSASPIIGIEKRCPRCKEIKTIEAFGIKRSAISGRDCYCRKCAVERTMQWVRANPERAIEQRKKYYIANKEMECKKSLQWAKNNPDKNRNRSNRWARANVEKVREMAREYRNANIEKCRENCRKWYRKNREKACEHSSKWSKENPDKIKIKQRKAYLKKVSTLQGLLRMRLSSAIYCSLKMGKKGQHWETLVGYTVADLKKHIEKQFKDGMTWENWGRRGWHLDHKIPISVFNFEKPEDDDFKRCWSLKNLQPLWAKDNIVKNNKLTKHFQPRLIF